MITFRENKIVNIIKKLSIKFIGTSKLNLKLYAKYKVNKEIKISLNKKNKILLNGVGVSNIQPF